MFRYRSRNHTLRVGLFVLLGGVTVPAFAAGPSNQLVPNPIAPGNTANAVVQLADATQQLGTGTIIGARLVGGIGYLSILTADHVIAEGADRIGFANGDPSATTFNIIRTIGATQRGDTVDMAVSLVEYGPQDAFFNSLPIATLTIGNTADGTQYSLIGFGNTAPAVTDGGGNLTNLGPKTNTYGTKRFQNNRVTAHVPNFNQGIYTYNALSYTFDSQGQPNYVAGEGSGYDADSGGPWFSSQNADPDGAGGLPGFFTNTIISIELAGPSGNVGIFNGDVAYGLDAYYYSEYIRGSSSTVLGAVGAPEPGTAGLILCGLVGVGGLALRRKR